MFNSNIIDVAIGMIFIYLLLSLMCSAANEMIELMLKKRAIDLERGIRELLCPGTKSGTNDIVQELYNHALINNLFGGTYKESKIGSRLRPFRRTQLPSYIPARNFALALMDLVALPADATRGAKPADAEPETSQEGEGPSDTSATSPQAGAGPAEAPPDSLLTEPLSGAAGATVAPPASVSPAQVVVNLSENPPPAPAPPAPEPVDNPVKRLRDAICNTSLLRDDVSRRALVACLDAAGNDMVKVRENIESWYNSSMDRVSSWYKRRVQLTILVIGIFVAITVNVDTITVAKRLSTDKGLRESLVNAADAYAKANASPSATSTPTPTPAPTPTPTGSGETTTTAAAATSNPSPSPGPTTSPSPSPTPTPLPECVKDPASDECKEAKLNKACEDPDSAKCQLAKACTEPDSAECQQARALQKACSDPNSAKCKYLSNEQQLRALGLPIGWGDKNDPKRNFSGWTWAGDRGGWWDQVRWHWLGWLLTALAISLGAPFWFDLLNKFIVIRSAVKPQEKSSEKESKD